MSSITSLEPSLSARQAGSASGPGVRRLALSPDEAASSLGVSRDFLDEHVMPDLRVVRLCRRRLIPLGELERWLDRSALRTLPH